MTLLVAGTENPAPRPEATENVWAPTTARSEGSWLRCEWTRLTSVYPPPRVLPGVGPQASRTRVRPRAPHGHQRPRPCGPGPCDTPEPVTTARGRSTPTGLDWVTPSRSRRHGGRGPPGSGARAPRREGSRSERWDVKHSRCPPQRTPRPGLGSCPKSPTPLTRGPGPELAAGAEDTARSLCPAAPRGLVARHPRR